MRSLPRAAPGWSAASPHAGPDVLEALARRCLDAGDDDGAIMLLHRADAIAGASPQARAEAAGRGTAADPSGAVRRAMLRAEAETRRERGILDVRPGGTRDAGRGRTLPRVALCVSGLPRCWETGLASQRALLEPLAADVFTAFWTDGFPAAEVDRAVEAYAPVIAEVGPSRDWRPFAACVGHHDRINDPARMLSMYDGIRRADRLRRRHEVVRGRPYDVVVRLRSDLRFGGPVGDGASVADALRGHLVLSTQHDFGIVNDMLALGDGDALRWYATLGDRALALAARVTCNPELLLLEHLRSRPSSLAVTRAPIPFAVMRPHMAGWPLEACLAEPPGRSKWRDPEVVRAHVDFHARRDPVGGAAHVERFAAAQLGTAQLASAPG